MSSPDEQPPLPVSLASFAAFSPEDAATLLRSPAPLLEHLQPALVAAQELLLAELQNRDSHAAAKLLVKLAARPRLEGLALFMADSNQGGGGSQSISAVCAPLIGRLITVLGTVVKAGAVRVLESKRVHECIQCKHRWELADEAECCTLACWISRLLMLWAGPAPHQPGTPTGFLWALTWRLEVQWSCPVHALETHARAQFSGALVCHLASSCGMPHLPLPLSGCRHCEDEGSIFTNYQVCLLPFAEAAWQACGISAACPRPRMLPCQQEVKLQERVQCRQAQGGTPKSLTVLLQDELAGSVQVGREYQSEAKRLAESSSAWHVLCPHQILL